jgi:AcrR family transcriptional regulator
VSARPRPARRATKTEVVEQFRTETILEAMLRVISRDGIAGVTMSRVAAEAGVSRPTLYLYFKDRDELVERTATLVMDRMKTDFDQAFASSGTFDERLRALIRTKVSLFHRHREFFRVFVETCGGTARTKHRKRYEQYLRRLAAFLKEGMDQGAVRPLDPDRLALFVAEAIHAIVLHRLSESSPSDPTTEADWIATTLLRGIAMEAPSS